MLDYQRIVEEIQAAIHSQGTLDWDLLRDASAEYAAACDEVNTRLERISKLLRQGLRSEAIQLADLEPPLLDSAAILDFPELPEWVQLLTINGMVPPPAIRIETASDLNAAYALEAPLMAHLKSHRLLALARAPLAVRIQTLRQIHRADAHNPIWATDLTILETARQTEIARQAEECTTSRHLPALEQLCHELAMPDWLAQPRRDFIDSIARRRDRLVVVQAREKLEAIEGELANCYGAFDVAAGRAARDAWNREAAKAGLMADDPLAQAATPALAWLAEQDRREARDREFAIAVDNLERALEEEKDRATLTRLFHAMERLEQRPPDLLLRRYHEQMRQFETAQRRRFVLITSATVLALLLVAGGISWVAIRASEHRRMLATAEQLRQLIDSSQWKQASELLAQLQVSDPRIAQATEIQSQNVRLQELEKAESERRAAFEQYLQQARSSDPERPDRLALSEAKKVAIGAAEKADVARLEAEFASLDRARQQKRDTEFQASLETILFGVEKFEATLADDPVAPVKELAQLIAEIDALGKSTGGVSTSLIAQLAPLKLRLTSLQQQRAARMDEYRALEQLTTHIGQPEAYQSALQKFVEKFPTSPLAIEFARTTAELPYWEVQERWRKLLGQKAFRSLPNVQPLEAAKLLEEANEIQLFGQQSPLAEKFDAKRKYLQGIADRLDDDGQPIVKQLDEVFKDVFITGLWYVEATGGDRYYLSKSFEQYLAKPGETIGFEHIVSFDLQTLTKRHPRSGIARHGTAPQAALASAARTHLAIVTNGDWEKGMYGLLRATLDDTETDPLLKFILVQRILETAETGSHSIAEALGPSIARVKGADVDVTANWLLPTDAAAAAARLKARALLGSLSDLSSEARKAAEILRADTSPIEVPPEWIGVLVPIGEGRWKCLGSPQVAVGELYVIDPTAEKSAGGIWQRVGTYDRAKTTWQNGTSNSMAAGRPLYLVTRGPGALSSPADQPSEVSSRRSERLQ